MVQSGFLPLSFLVNRFKDFFEDRKNYDQASPLHPKLQSKSVQTTTKKYRKLKILNFQGWDLLNKAKLKKRMQIKSVYFLPIFLPFDYSSPPMFPFKLNLISVKDQILPYSEQGGGAKTPVLHFLIILL